MKISHFFTMQRELKMVWEVVKGGKKSHIVGAAHFFPYSFKKSLTRHISNADTVLLEGPLDENSMNSVVENGSGEGENCSLDKHLDAHDINEINKLEYTITTRSYFGMYMMTFGESQENSLYRQIKNKRPWMAFFTIWLYYRLRKRWNYTMDMDALKIAEALGKEVHFLEKIEEQIDALNGIPVEKIARFLKRIDQWDTYAKRYLKYYLRGDLDALMAYATDFPTFCESIIDRRDPILYERMRPFVEKGGSLAIVGVTHIHGIRKKLLLDGYTVTHSALS